MESSDGVAQRPDTIGTEAEPAPQTFGMGDTLVASSSEAIAIKGNRNKHGKGARKIQQMAVSPMRDESKQMVALATANAKRTRRPRNGFGDVRGNPKKAGGGGKGTWGKITDVVDGKAAADNKDPNYDSSTEDDIMISETRPEVSDEEVATLILPIFKEYCSHGNSEEVADAFDEFNFSGVGSDIICIVVEYALEHKSSVRELASILLSDLYGRCIAVKDYPKAFDTLLDNLDELLLDTPDATVALGNFIARSVADDCLAPAFLHSRSPGSSHVEECVKHADCLLSMPHGMARLDSVWGPVLGGLRPVKTLENDMEMILREFVSSNQMDECGRCLKQLNVPHFHYEFVYLAVRLVLEGDQTQVHESVAACLKYLCEQDFITAAQLDRGFRRVFDQVEDIHLDVPFVYPVLSGFTTRCRNMGVISQEIYDLTPAKARQRFVSDSEGDTRVEKMSPSV